MKELERTPMKNKDRYNLAHISWKIEERGTYAKIPYYHITLYHENIPVIGFDTEKAPFKAILEWLEMELEDY